MMNNPDLTTPTNVDANGLPITQSIAPAQPTTINPGVKPSGAPVSFSPKAQNTMTGVFGNPVANSYDRSMSGPTPIPDPTIDRNTPISNFQNT